VRLLGVELRRAFARRLTKAVFILSLAGIIATGLSVFFTSGRETTHTLPNGPKVAKFLEECTKGTLPSDQPLPELPAVGSSERAAACQQFVDENAGETVDKRFYITNLMDIIKHVSAMAAILAWLLGASFIGAEWRSGSLATLLTWEPRRVRVLVAKALAAVIVSFVVVMVLQALLVGALYPSAVYHGSTAITSGPGPTFPSASGFWRSFSYLGLRSGALAAGAALAGFAIGAIGRNTAASLGAGFFYIAVVEGAIVGNFIPKARPWLLVRNAIVFINNDRLFELPHRTPLQAGVITFGYAVALFGIATLITRARDVN